MENKYEFYFDKKLTKKKLIKNSLIFAAFTTASAIILINLKSVQLTEVMISLAPIAPLYLTIRTWLAYKYTGPVIIVYPKYISLINMNYLFNFIEKNIQIDEIKTIGTDIKMKGDRVLSESLSFKMINDEKYLFPIDLFEINHLEIYNKIKELNPDAKLFNVGEFVYDA